MKIIKDTLDFKINEDVILSLGKFDGIHRGHSLLMDALKEGKKRGLKSAVLTFSISPKVHFDSEMKILTTDEEKMQLLYEDGIDYVIECPFNDEIMKMDAEAFLKMLADRMPIREIVAGTDFRFGYKRQGDHELLKRCAPKYGYQIKIFEKRQFEGTDISSTRIRRLLTEGEIEKANELLGYEYFFCGKVLHGNELGRTIAAPTANLLPPAAKLLPPFGVYAAHIAINGDIYRGISNIGKKPTVNGEYPAGVETYIFDFDDNLYDKAIKVSLCSYIRPERKFRSLEELKKQMKKDIQICKDRLDKYEAS
ncbi:Riboflavin biosynthesis protein ribF [uncultured Roseburia sp.]|uniref:Riboflavin biosynthesis protein n=1 Tax=Brotonthovivens ammoniilytica TaxID=2981725 RepID=A0ABT2THI5_9FIRM|nr:bifunctional riboflavin kinase/FAD synthetase [Brotonthovivens ammoniilytica]MCU6761351.1 bifunctional riboflavin kinase/FAD synthetase [Brotonthovivens ammoniilytica]SCI25990.1 Riboflavin biosynthesis protein ribF [uncultured Roseburia sp.]